MLISSSLMAPTPLASGAQTKVPLSGSLEAECGIQTVKTGKNGSYLIELCFRLSLIYVLRLETPFGDFTFEIFG